ncbi:MAG: hypothetical protein IPL13_10660 [Saprospiraceae bacterium]|nr:hypothetical protein [Candidatus Brachybacter algidus]
MPQELLNKLEIELSPKINEILNHPVINSIQKGELTRDQLRKFAIQYSIYCGYFPRFFVCMRR